MLVLPGGGYDHHAPHEAEAIGEWLNGLGIHAFVLRYPVAPHRHPEPVAAARRALVDLRAGEFGAVDAARVGVVGFSAGGHLAAMLSNAPTAAERAVHALDDRPDLAVLGYPVISMTDLPHEGSAVALLGPGASRSARAAVDADRLVDAGTPPTFLWHTADDGAVPPTHSLAYARALALHEVPVDLHLYAEGEHGRGLAVGRGPLAGWSALAAEWLAGHGW